MKKYLKTVLIGALCASLLMLTSCVDMDDNGQQSQVMQESQQQSSQPTSIEPVSDVSELPSSQEISSEEPSSVASEESYPDYSEYDEIAKSIFSDYLTDQKSSSLSGEERIKDYKITYLEVREADETGFQFYVEYDILPDSPSEFIIAGNGEEGNDDWYVGLGRYVTTQKQGDNYIILSISMSPSF